MSEFGFQAFPTMETVESYAALEDRNPISYIMEHHQRGRHGNGLIIAQMTDAFRMPVSFTGWIYLSLVPAGHRPTVSVEPIVFFLPQSETLGV